MLFGISKEISDVFACDNTKLNSYYSFRSISSLGWNIKGRNQPGVKESALKTLGWDTEELRLEKNNVLLIGPTGCGQYFMVESWKSDINFVKKNY